MAEDQESRAGIFSGIVAGVMVLALTAMAFMTLDPARASPHYALFHVPTHASSVTR